MKPSWINYKNKKEYFQIVECFFHFYSSSVESKTYCVWVSLCTIGDLKDFLRSRFEVDFILALALILEPVPLS